MSAADDAITRAWSEMAEAALAPLHAKFADLAAAGMRPLPVSLSVLGEGVPQIAFPWLAFVLGRREDLN